MFIHLGDDIVIRSKDVIAILDSQLLSAGGTIHEVLEGQKRNNKIIEVAEDNVKSIVITTGNIYLSPLSSVTLKRRSQMISELDAVGE